MANVLPLKNRITLRRNYWLRLFITFSLVITATMIIGIVSLVPSYILARTQLLGITQYEVLQKKTNKINNNNNAIQISRLVNTQIEVLRKSNNTSAARAMNLILRDWMIYKDNIIISSLTYNSSKYGKETIQKLRISGESKDRASLNSFVQTLRADPSFSDVSFPVSDLIGSNTLNFSLVVQLKLTI